ncbi:YqgE/AlgH family protein [Microbulbifer agarilyticus]|uniref:YqgE/AlgH family protein n=1 Tax=Microbulbifer agarilyticus TaxID=260552 RepID=UPI001C9815BE|nr:YqgE/AlgH family protein [Microbulbifer agarilyticus]MBY6189941.1 YqgE/AlgH family protein [Microbulbifer agarilyticus]MBY6209940.1 YqgE/AlgH family protein [Microbulbifer agarilyticus]MCA0894725.1 YqgE/AlgH family protein [Microbulbifer agarilyticus]
MQPTNTDKLDSDLTSNSLRGQLLLAMPGMQDPRFVHAVAFVCEHSADGTMGVVINAPSKVTWKEVFSQLELDDVSLRGDEPVLVGGPVAQEQGFVLHGRGMQFASTAEVSEDISLTASKDIIESLAAGRGPDDVLLALGYAGWGPGQLEEEIAENAWLTLPASAEILFATPWEKRWQAAAARHGIDLSGIGTQSGHA